MKFRLIVDPTAEESVVVTARRPSALTQSIEDLVLSDAGEDRIAVRDGDGLLWLAFREIECLTVSERRVVALAENGKRYRVSGSLAELEGRLPSYFLRINKSTIANEYAILRFCATFHGGIDAHFRCGYKDYISRRCYAEIKRRLRE